MMTSLPIISFFNLKNKVTLGILIAVGIITPIVIGYFLLFNPIRPRADSPATPVTPVTLPTLATGSGTPAPSLTPTPTLPVGVPSVALNLYPVKNLPVNSGIGTITFFNMNSLVFNKIAVNNGLLVGKLIGMKPYTVYSLVFCSQKPTCFAVGNTLNVTTDKNGIADLRSNISLPIDPLYAVYEIHIVNYATATLDRERCDSSGLCLSGAFAFPGGASASPTTKPSATPTLTPKPPTATPIPPSKIDLAVKSITRDNQYYYYVEYCNYGSGPVTTKTNFLVKLSSAITGKSFNTPAVFPVPAAGQCAKTGGITCGLIGSTCKDTMTISATVDGTNVVAEVNEQNNSMSQAFGGRVTLTPVPMTNVTINAVGTPVDGGYPSMSVELDGKQAYANTVVGGTFTARQFKIYSFATNLVIKPKTLTIRFLNDAYKPPQDRNIFVDSVVVNGKIYQAEDPSVYSSSCTAGYKKTETLACTGYMTFTLK